MTVLTLPVYCVRPRLVCHVLFYSGGGQGLETPLGGGLCLLCCDRRQLLKAFCSHAWSHLLQPQISKFDLNYSEIFARGSSDVDLV